MNALRADTDPDIMDRRIVLPSHHHNRETLGTLLLPYHILD